MGRFDCISHFELWETSFTSSSLPVERKYQKWQINVRKGRRANQEWTIQRHGQHWVHKTQDEDKQNKKLKRICATRTPPKTGNEPM